MLIDPGAEVVRVSPEGNAQQFEELVHAVEQRLRRVRGGVGRGGALEHDDAVRQVCGHDEVVLDHEACPLGVQDESGKW